MELEFVIDRKYDRQFVRGKKSLACFAQRYETSLKYLKRTVRLYQESWDEIGDRFSTYVEEETGYRWFYPTYRCVVSVMQRGISNWGHEPTIVRGWMENPYTMRRITAHELILSHYFEIYRHHYAARGLTDKQVWALAEIAAFALTSLTKEASHFWPWDCAGYYTNHNYPEIVPLQKKLRTIFLRRKSFDEYIERGIVLVRQLRSL